MQLWLSSRRISRWMPSLEGFAVSHLCDSSCLTASRLQTFKFSSGITAHDLCSRLCAFTLTSTCRLQIKHTC